MGLGKEFPFVATTYRLTEHFHFWTKHTRIAAVLQPEAFVEIGEELARLRGIGNGDKVVVRSKRGVIKAKALVTKRIHALKIEGKDVHTVGLPIHWGFEGLTKPGYLTNTLTPFIGDANIQTPEFKAFLVDVQKA
jgi:formate dehydrogenase major subunit